MKISVKLYFVTAIAIGLICLLAIFGFEYSLQIKNAQKNSNVANQLVRQTTYLVIILDEYLAYHYERSEQQWQKISTELSLLAEGLSSADAQLVLTELKDIEAGFSRLQVEYKLRQDFSSQSWNGADLNSSAEIRERLSSQIRVSSNKILSRAFLLSKLAGKEIQATNQRNAATALWLAAILVLFLGGSSVLIIKGITKPLNALVADAEKIGAGDLTHAISLSETTLEQHKRSEIGVLGVAFKRMTSQLATTIHTIKKSESRYRMLFESVGVSLWEEDCSEILRMLDLLSAQGVTDIPSYIRENPGFVATAAGALKILEVNGATLKMFNAKDKEELLNSLDKIFIPESLPAFRDVLIALAEGREHFETEAVNGTLDGEKINVLISVNYSREYKAQGILTVSIADITALKRGEQALSEYRDHLEELVAERTQALERVNEDYAQANNELKEFAYIVSHDLKAPLRAISQLTHWIADDYSSAFDADGKTQMALILQRVKRMDGLIDGILRYSRVGRIREKDERLDLNCLVHEIIDSLAPPDTVQVTIKNELPVVSRDTTRMEQVFQNLIGNALQYMDKDKGIVSISCRDEGSLWTFCVADNGPGIAEKYHQKIFQIFQSLTSRDEHESTGIGLALVKKIIGIYGGTIWVESEEGFGSQFFFTLPKKGEAFEKL